VGNNEDALVKRIDDLETTQRYMKWVLWFLGLLSATLVGLVLAIALRSSRPLIPTASAPSRVSTREFVAVDKNVNPAARPHRPAHHRSRRSPRGAGGKRLPSRNSLTRAYPSRRRQEVLGLAHSTEMQVLLLAGTGRKPRKRVCLNIL